MDGPPLPDGGILVDGDGLVAAVGPVASLPAPPEGRDLRFRGVLLPGLVNLHTHLELTGLAIREPPDRFVSWIREVRLRKAERTATDVAAAARQGVRQALAAGVTTVADTGDAGVVLPALAEAGLSGVVYQEVFGPHPDQAGESLSGLDARLDQLEGLQRPGLRLGVSPHAPYTVSSPLYRGVAELAARRRLPVALHLAESPAETDLVTRDGGPFADAWRDRGIPLPGVQGRGLAAGARRSPVAWVDAHGLLGPGTLVIHAVQLDDLDVALLAARRVTVAHCPRSNARHGHGAAPLSALLAAGALVGVGTDSELSVDRIDLLAEARAARALGGLDARTALELATTRPAAALGLGTRVGRLGIGFRGDLVALDLAVPPGASPEEAVLRSGPDQVAATVVGGRVVYRGGLAA